MLDRPGIWVQQAFLCSVGRLLRKVLAICMSVLAPPLVTFWDVGAAVHPCMLSLRLHIWVLCKGLHLNIQCELPAKQVHGRHTSIQPISTAYMPSSKHLFIQHSFALGLVEEVQG